MSYDGTWNITMQSPMGAQKMTLVATVADGVLSGPITAADGTVTQIANGKADGAAATWDLALTKPMPITLGFTATLDGDKITGSAKLGAFGNAKFEGTRAA
jgi:hypothetical protein